VRLRAKGEGLKERFFAFALGLYRNLKFFLPSPPFLKGDSWSLQAGKNPLRLPFKKGEGEKGNIL